MAYLEDQLLALQRGDAFAPLNNYYAQRRALAGQGQAQQLAIAQMEAQRRLAMEDEARRVLQAQTAQRALFSQQKALADSRERAMQTIEGLRLKNAMKVEEERTNRQINLETKREEAAARKVVDQQALRNGVSTTGKSGERKSNEEIVSEINAIHAKRAKTLQDAIDTTAGQATKAFDTTINAGNLLKATLLDVANDPLVMADLPPAVQQRFKADVMAGRDPMPYIGELKNRWFGGDKQSASKLISAISDRVAKTTELATAKAEKQALANYQTAIVKLKELTDAQSRSFAEMTPAAVSDFAIETVTQAPLPGGGGVVAPSGAPADPVAAFVPPGMASPGRATTGGTVPVRPAEFTLPGNPGMISKAGSLLAAPTVNVGEALGTSAAYVERAMSPVLGTAKDAWFGTTPQKIAEVEASGLRQLMLAEMTPIEMNALAAKVSVGDPNARRVLEGYRARLRQRAAQQTVFPTNPPPAGPMEWTPPEFQPAP